MYADFVHLAHMATVVFPGRFQPFHNAHLTLLNRLRKRFRCVILAIGSSDLQNSDNPFSLRQRKEMIENALSFEEKSLRRKNKLRKGKSGKKPRKKEKTVRLGNVVFASIPHAPDSRWVSVFLSRVSRKRFDVVFTNNPRVKKQLKKHGIPSIGSPLIRRSHLVGGKIRAWPKDWKKRVPEGVASYLSARLNFS